MRNFLSFCEFLKMERQDLYPSRWALAGVSVANLVSLTIYWFTSKAFSSSVESIFGSLGLDYFHFILIGELALMLPIVLVEGVSQSIRQSVANGTMETFLLLPVNFDKPFILWTLSKAWLEFLRLLFLALAAYAIFSFQISFFAALQFLCLMLVTTPFFLALGTFAAAILVHFGRGEKVITFVVNLTTIFSGLYFPTTVLPESLQKFIASSSPFYFILDQSRKIFGQQATTGVFNILMFFAMGILLLTMAIFSLNLSLRQARAKAKPLLFRY